MKEITTRSYYPIYLNIKSAYDTLNCERGSLNKRQAAKQHMEYSTIEREQSILKER